MKRIRQTNRWTNCELLFSWFVFLLFFLATCLNSLSAIVRRDFLNMNYASWEISEWLINYEGGFVRRGIMGQMLWALEQWFPFDVRVALMGVCIIASALMLWGILRLFRKEGWALLIIPTGFCLGYTLFSLWGRRDYISLMLTFSIFLIFKQVISHPRSWTRWAAFYALSAFQLLMHEAAFFYTFPILMLYSYCQGRDSRLSASRSALRCLVQFLPILIVMAAACLFKGGEDVAQSIWGSWLPIIGNYQDDTSKMGFAMVALTWDVKATFVGHFTSAFIGDVSPAAWRAPLALLNLLAVYYLTTRLNAVNMGIYKPKPMNHVLMSNVVLVQLIALLPMFTVLSCDWGRTLPYCAISSMFFYHLFKDEPVRFMPSLTAASSKIQTFISGNRTLRSPYTYILLVMLAPVPTYKAPLDHINTFQQKFFYLFTDLFHQLATFIS